MSMFVHFWFVLLASLGLVDANAGIVETEV